MNIYRDIEKIAATNAVVTVGTYDGVHKGHQHVIDKLRESAARIGGETVLLTFWPHPRMVIQSDRKDLRLLNTLDEKIELLRKTGIDHLVVYPFTREFSKIASEEFVRDILIKKIGAKHLVVGHDHRFGSKREGGIELLERLAKDYDFSVEQVGVLNHEHFAISSTQIRRALEIGDLELARSFLGYNYHAHGVVSQGNKLGRSIGFPTANLKVENFKMMPADGVYAVKAQLDDKIHWGMANIGIRPTIDRSGSERTFEIHIFDFMKKIYGKTIRVEFLSKIRDEKKFDDMNALKFQLERDKEKVWAYLKKEYPYIA